MIGVAEAIFESTGSSELAASVSLLLRPSRLSELDDDDGSISYLESDNNG